MYNFIGSKRWSLENKRSGFTLNDLNLQASVTPLRLAAVFHTHRAHVAFSQYCEVQTIFVTIRSFQADEMKEMSNCR